MQGIILQFWCFHLKFWHNKYTQTIHLKGQHWHSTKKYSPFLRCIEWQQIGSQLWRMELCGSRASNLLERRSSKTLKKQKSDLLAFPTMPCFWDNFLCLFRITFHQCALQMQTSQASNDHSTHVCRTGCESFAAQRFSQTPFTRNMRAQEGDSKWFENGMPQTKLASKTEQPKGSVTYPQPATHRCRWNRFLATQTSAVRQSPLGWRRRVTFF